MTRFLYYGLFSVILMAAMVLAYFSYRSAMRFERLGEETIFEGTLLVARERVERVEQLVIDSDNRVFQFVDLLRLEDVEARWNSIAEISRMIKSLIVLDDQKQIVLYLTNEDVPRARWFRGLFQREILEDLELGPQMVDLHKHLHGSYSGRYYLISYITHLARGRRYTICVNNDVDAIIARTFTSPELAGQPRGQRLNVVDQEGRIIFGDRLAGAEDFIVAHPFPTTFYQWRLQVTPLHAPELENRAQQKKLSDAILIGLALGVIVLGMSFYLYAVAKERRLNVLRSEFISNVTHELKTPLSLIKMFSELLMMEKTPDDARRRRYCEILSRESDRLGSLIDTVLDFSRIERGRTKYEKADADAGEVVRHAVEIFRMRLEREAIEVKLDVAERIPILVDEQALTLAVLNLLDNAHKYAEGTQEIRVAVRRELKKVLISVSDDGPGIPQEEIRRVFDRFFRGRSAVRSRARGSGIGLSIVHAVAAGHDGRVWVESRAGAGATFVIELPVLTR